MGEIVITFQSLEMQGNCGEPKSLSAGTSNHSIFICRPLAHCITRGNTRKPAALSHSRSSAKLMWESKPLDHSLCTLCHPWPRRCSPVSSGSPGELTSSVAQNSSMGQVILLCWQFTTAEQAGDFGEKERKALVVLSDGGLTRSATCYPTRPQTSRMHGSSLS